MTEPDAANALSGGTPHVDAVDYVEANVDYVEAKLDEWVEYQEGLLLRSKSSTVG